MDGAIQHRFRKLPESSGDRLIGGGSDEVNEVDMGSILELTKMKPSVETSRVEELAEGGDSKCPVNGIVEGSSQSVHNDDDGGEKSCRELNHGGDVGNGVQVADETALVEPASVHSTGNECGSEMGFVGSAEVVVWYGVRSMNQELDGKKVKRSRRRGKGRKVLQVEESQRNLMNTTMDEVEYHRNGDGPKIMYSREEMEAMRFLKIVEQEKLWKELYDGLGPVVAKEYDELGSARHQKQFALEFDPRQRFAKKERATEVLGVTSSETMSNGLENLKHNGTDDANTLDHACSESVGGEDGYTDLEEECAEDYDSEEDYASIQRPAFMVAGEPNFDSGPVEDGFEYLRRVRWEAAHIPKVKVAKLDRSKLKKEQSVYMPQIEDIAKCPEHLLPSKQWEEAFLADFSELRLALSRLEDSKASHQLLDDSILESDEATEDDNTSLPPENTNPSAKASADESSVNDPKLSTILALEPVARVSMLRKRISAAESMTALSRDDCLWLFALCAAVDTPLNADMCASLRSLLRKCAALRSEKSQQDDELGMLNILITVSGRFFGQLE